MDNIEFDGINKDNIWLDVDVVAKLKGITNRGVRLALNNGKYTFKEEKYRGNKTYKIQLSSLEKEYNLNI